MSLAQLGLGMPMGAEWLCILAFVGIFVAVVVIAILARGRRPAPHGFPIGPPSGPGKFKVSGVKRDSRQDVVWYCESDSPANTQVKAELEGIIVTAIERQAE